MRKYLGALLALIVSANLASAISLNTRGEVAQGIGGNVAAIDDRVIATNAGGTSWVDSDHVIYQQCDTACRLWVYSTQTKTAQIVAESGANSLTAGGGSWAAWLNGRGVFTSDTRAFVSAGLGPMSPDGALAIKIDYYGAGPWDVVEKDGSRWRLTNGDAWDIDLLGAHVASFHDAVGVHAVNLPQPQVLPGTVWWFRTIVVNGQPWALYQSEAASGRLVLHPFDSFVGYSVSNGGSSYRPDGVVLNPSTVRIAYAVREDEGPGTVVVDDVNLNAARVDVRSFLTPVTPPPVHVPTTPEPPPPVVVVQEPASLIDDVRAIRATYGDILSPAQLADLLNRVAWKNRAAGWGLLAKPGGNNCPAPSGVLVSCDILFHKPSGLHYDVLGAAGDPHGSVPTWGLSGPMDTSRWLAPVDPGTPTTTTPPPPVPAPQPVEDPRVALLTAQVAALTQHTKDQEQQIADVQALQHAAETERDTAKAALAAELAKPAPSCEVVLPSWAKSLGLRIGCRVK